jgi:hypothetical protein
MASEKEARVSRHGFSVAYDGAASDEHSIDVENLAPALLAFGKLIREANVEFNGKKATSKVLVVSDFEAKCFHVNFDVILSLYEQIKSLLDSPDVSTAKTILEWLGLLGLTGGGGTRSASIIRSAIATAKPAPTTQSLSSHASAARKSACITSWPVITLVPTLPKWRGAKITAAAQTERNT